MSTRAAIRHPVELNSCLSNPRKCEDRLVLGRFTLNVMGDKTAYFLFESTGDVTAHGVENRRRGRGVGVGATNRDI